MSKINTKLILKKVYIICTLCIFFSIKMVAQTKTLEHANQQWFQYYNQFKINNKYTLFSDLGLRKKNSFELWSQNLVRVGIGYKLYKNIQGVTGLACFVFYNNANKLNRLELRPYQEVLVNYEVGKANVQQRLRVEARFFNQIKDNRYTDSNNFNFRFRYRVNITIPLLSLSEKHKEKKLLLNIGDELFINAGKQIVYNMIDYNRLLIGPAVRFNKNWLVSLIYSYQFGQENKPALYKQSDVVWMAVTHNIQSRNVK